jgi:hypothetical protein
MKTVLLATNSLHLQHRMSLTLTFTDTNHDKVMSSQDAAFAPDGIKESLLLCQSFSPFSFIPLPYHHQLLLHIPPTIQQDYSIQVHQKYDFR